MKKEINTICILVFGADGARVMFGRLDGVRARMAAVSPHLLHVHCVELCVALMASDASKHTKEIAPFGETVKGLYKLFPVIPANHTKHIVHDVFNYVAATLCLKYTGHNFKHTV